MPSTEPVLVWDVDDVLNDLTLEWLRAAHQTTTTPFEELTEPRLHIALGIDEHEYLSSLDRFRLDGGFESLLPRPDVLTWFREHGDRARHVALTATPLRSAPVSAAWVMAHFGRWIRTFHVVPSRRHDDDAPTLDHDKHQALRFLGIGDVMIDDRTENLEGAASAGLETVRFPRPWNGAGSADEALGSLTRLLDGETSDAATQTKDQK